MTMISKFKIVGAVLLCMAIYGAGYHHAKALGDLALRTAQRDAYEAHLLSIERARLIESERSKRLQAVAEADALRRQEREVITREITNEVIRYVQTPVSTECGLDPGGVRLHDLAASGIMPGSPDDTAASYGRATAAEVVTVVTENYSTCHAIRDKLISLQETVRNLWER